MGAGREVTKAAVQKKVWGQQISSVEGPALLRSQTGAQEELLGRVKTCEGI